MAEHWYFHPQLPAVPGGVATLQPEEARHAIGAKRLRADESIVLFDGRGGLAHGRVEPGGPKTRQLRVSIHRIEHCPAPAQSTELIASLPKGDRATTMLGMCTQLGMNRFRAADFHRGVSRPGRNAAQRWHRTAIESCKQCHRPWLPEFLPTTGVDGLCEEIGAGGERLWMLADRDGGSLAHALESKAASELRAFNVSWIVGPEGGLTDEERMRLVHAGAVPVSLGSWVLRIETAAVAAAAATAALVCGTDSRGSE